MLRSFMDTFLSTMAGSFSFLFLEHFLLLTRAASMSLSHTETTQL